jgi:hypothetical protein
MKTFRTLTILFLFFLPVWLVAQRVTVSANKFIVGTHEIFMNGANTPWNYWNDFGGNYQSSWWDSEFKRIKDAGGNSTRIWITCNGDVGITISSDGTVTGATEDFWNNLDDMFQLAQKNKIYIKATLISFDHFKSSHTTYQEWRKMVNSDDKVTSFVNNYAVPFVKRYNDNPYLWAVDVCNEIEWVNQNAECGNIPWSRLQYLVARTASAIHENSQVLVTLGSAAVKWNSTKGDGNYWSDANLKNRYNKENARLDFYSPHFYGWVVRWFGNFAIDKTPAYYGINDRPCVIGENPAKGVYDEGADPALVVPASDMFLGAWDNGWKGLMPWTSNGVDDNGNLNDFKSGLLAFKQAFPGMVDPSLAVGIDQDLKQNQVGLLIGKVFPNPAVRGQITIQLAQYENVMVQLTDDRGIVLFRQNADKMEMTIQTNTLSKGIYLISVMKNRQVESRKLVLK